MAQTAALTIAERIRINSLNSKYLPTSDVLNIAHPLETEDCCNMHRSHILYISTQNSQLAC